MWIALVSPGATAIGGSSATVSSVIALSTVRGAKAPHFTQPLGSSFPARCSAPGAVRTYIDAAVALPKEPKVRKCTVSGNTPRFSSCWNSL